MTCSWSPCSTRTTHPEAGDPKNFSAAFPQIPLHPASGCDTLNMCPAGFVIDLFLTHISLYGTPDQCVVRRPPGCRPRLEVGSGKARWRQPTCPERVQVITDLHGHRGAPDAGQISALLFSASFQEVPVFYRQTSNFPLAQTAGIRYNTTVRKLRTIT